MADKEPKRENKTFTSASESKFGNRSNIVKTKPASDVNVPPPTSLHNTPKPDASSGGGAKK
jgi:hypothetical protein